MSSTNITESTNGVGLGYGIAITVGILVLISTIMLASYVCVRVKAGGGGGSSGGSNRLHHQNSTGVSPEPIVLVGLDGQTIDSFPKLMVGESRRLPEPNNGPCPICLTDYRSNDTVRCMPDCNHCYHLDCIDEWLRMSATCPLCRNSPAPSQTTTPVATPLSELVPLALHSR
ncbi:zinc finger protein [Macleaya cordata]|uniref:Zinc finger protein n=1 Tax=Macleaya cordata TaxID=56857 RepID=A0A200QWF1_MACCD|nr:zinc finger protein [Macleaya cordata]